MSTELQNLIELAWEGRADLSPATADPTIRAAVDQVIGDLDAGRLRVAERMGVGQWTVNQWVKKAVLLSFRLKDNQVVQAGDLGFYDKVDTKFSHASADDMRASGIRLLPPAVAKSTGVREVLRSLRLSVHNTIGIGDAENDHDMLDACEVGAAVLRGTCG